MKIHCCLLDRECRSVGAPARIHFNGDRFAIAVALRRRDRFAGRLRPDGSLTSSTWWSVEDLAGKEYVTWKMQTQREKLNRIKEIVEWHRENGTWNDTCEAVEEILDE